jgi:lysophospholipase L1-like esterase
MKLVLVHRLLTSQTLLAVTLALLIPASRAEAADADPKRWETAIAKFEEQDKESPPPRGEVLFVGSSSIRMWKLNESFPQEKYINRGFGGSQIADSTFYADRIVAPYEPRVVVLYAGDNDLASGKSSEQVAADYQAFVAKVHAKLPQTRIVFISIKPSISRWKLIDKVREANKLIAEFSKQNARLAIVDVEKSMLGDDGMPRPELFLQDGLHMTTAGYAIWTSLVAPHLAVDKKDRP